MQGSHIPWEQSLSRQARSHVTFPQQVGWVLPYWDWVCVAFHDEAKPGHLLGRKIIVVADPDRRDIP
jgi:hypothetical protein